MIIFRRLREWAKSFLFSIPFFSRKKEQANPRSPISATPKSTNPSTNNAVSSSSITPIVTALAQQPSTSASAPITQPPSPAVNAPITQPSTSQAENPFKQQEDTKAEIKKALNVSNKNVLASTTIQRLKSYLNNQIAPVDYKPTLNLILNELKNYPPRLIKNESDRKVIDELKNKVEAHLKTLTDNYISSLTSQHSEALKNGPRKASEPLFEIPQTAEECKRKISELKSKRKNPSLTEGELVRINCELTVLKRTFFSMTENDTQKIARFNQKHAANQRELKQLNYELANRNRG